MNEKRKRPYASKRKKASLNAQELGELIDVGLDGTGWYGINLDEGRPGRGRWQINRFSPDGHLIIESNKYESLSAAKDYVSTMIRKEGMNMIFQHMAERSG